MSMFGTRKGEDAKGGAAAVGQLSGGMYRVARQVDCLGDSCPRPQLMTKKALSEVRPKNVIEVLVDNPSSVEALPPMCSGLDATHLETIKDGSGWRVYIRKD